MERQKINAQSGMTGLALSHVMNHISKKESYRWHDTSPRSSSLAITTGRELLAVTKDYYNHALTIFALIAISTFLRLLMIGSQSLWLDEGISLVMTDSKTIEGTLTAIWSVTGGDKYQPVYFVLLALWRAVMGDAQVTLQLLSVIFGALTPVFLYIGIKPLFGHRHAMLSALFLACSAFCVSYSQEVRPYSYLLCLVTFQFLMFSPALTGCFGSRYRVVCFSIVTFLCCFSSVFLLMFSLVLAVVFLLSYRDVRLWLHWWGFAILAALPAVIYYAFTPAAVDLTIDAINTTDFQVWQNMIFALYGHLAGHTYGPPVSVLRTTGDVLTEISNYYLELTALIIVCGFLCISILKSVSDAICSKRDTALYVFFLLLAVLSFALALTFALITSINWMPRHSFYLMFPFAVLIPMAIFRYESTMDGIGRFQNVSSSSMAAFAGLLLINISANSNYYFDTDHWRDDNRSAARYLDMHVKENDASFMLWGEAYLLDYYGHANIKGLRRLEDAELIFKELSDALDEKDRVFVSINRVESWQRYSVDLYRMISESYELVPIAEFNSVTSYEIRHKPQLRIAS